jgi:hypothetical protein
MKANLGVGSVFNHVTRYNLASANHWPAQPLESADPFSNYTMEPK